MRVNNSSLSFTQGRIQLLWLHASMTSCTRKGSTLGDLSPLYLFCCYKFLKTSRKMLPLFCFSKCPPPTLARSIGTPQASWTGCEPYGDILVAQVISDKTLLFKRYHLLPHTILATFSSNQTLEVHRVREKLRKTKSTNIYSDRGTFIAVSVHRHQHVHAQRN